MSRKERKKEQGSAQVTLKLKDSKITMYHTDVTGVVLRSWSAMSGDWLDMFSNIVETFPDRRIIKR